MTIKPYPGKDELFARQISFESLAGDERQDYQDQIAMALGNSALSNEIMAMMDESLKHYGFDAEITDEQMREYRATVRVLSKFLGRLQKIASDYLSTD